MKFSEFKRYIDAIENVVRLKDCMCDLRQKDKSREFELYFPSLECEVSRLLESIMEDKGEWISYWIFELDFGRKYEDGAITEADGSIIKLETVEDLYNFLKH